MRSKNKKRGVCANCGKTCYIESHREPPRSVGGEQTIPLCVKCHMQHHKDKNHFAQWGRLGGKITAQRYPDLWKRNLKQYRSAK